MIPTQIHDNIVRPDTPAVYAYFIVKRPSLYPLALVCNDDDVCIGIIGSKEANPMRYDISRKTCGEICNRSFSFLENTDEDTLYSRARNLYAEKPLNTLPVVDENGVPIRLFGRFQAFFRDTYRSLPYYQYASGMALAAEKAKSLGYNSISALEFGVAKGRGLLHMESYAREIQQLYDISIDVYGFDSGVGLLPPVDFRDCTQAWVQGDYKMDFEVLLSKLHSANLIIGDICDTARTFINEYRPAPIGFISVDVDQYTPTVAIFDMLLNDDEFFLPIVHMYFDDVHDNLEFQGESLAIKEFNAKHKHIKISPEQAGYGGLGFYCVRNSTSIWSHQQPDPRLKWCNRFNHPFFSTKRESV